MVHFFWVIKQRKKKKKRKWSRWWWNGLDKAVSIGPESGDEKGLEGWNDYEWTTNLDREIEFEGAKRGQGPKGRKRANPRCLASLALSSPVQGSMKKNCAHSSFLVGHFAWNEWKDGPYDDADADNDKFLFFISLSFSFPPLLIVDELLFLRLMPHIYIPSLLADGWFGWGWVVYGFLMYLPVPEPVRPCTIKTSTQQQHQQKPRPRTRTWI